MSQLREKVARAIYDARWKGTDGAMDEDQRFHICAPQYLREADAAIRALVERLESDTVTKTMWDTYEARRDNDATSGYDDIRAALRAAVGEA